MPRRRTNDDPVNHERWLISYADFITLLFAFFVVMYSVSQVNDNKYQELMSSLHHVFKDGISTEEFFFGKAGEPRQSTPAVAGQNGTDEKSVDGQPFESGTSATLSDFQRLEDQFEEAFAPLIKSDMVRVQSNEHWFALEVNSSMLFESADARLTEEAVTIFQQTAEILAPYNNPVQVEGFTDDVPISNSRFASNWELSTARAASVVRLLADEGVDPHRLSATGFAEFKPVASNETPAGRAENRRVTIMVSKIRLVRPDEEPRSPPAAVQPTVDALRSEESSESPDTSNDQTPVKAETTAGAPTTPAEPAATAGSAEDARRRLDPVGNIKPVELKNGGLLFTADPEVEQRNSVKK